MPKRVKISEANQINIVRKFTGRLIGVVDDKECRAVLNVEDAARKISTAESVELNTTKFINDKRFVVVTSDLSLGNPKEIFISPKINHITLHGKKRIMHCRGGNDYSIEEI